MRHHPTVMLGFIICSLIVLLGGPSASPPPAAALAGPITVDGSTCTLVDAINSANSDSAVGGCTSGTSGLDTITLATNVALANVNNNTDGNNGLPSVTSEVWSCPKFVDS